jgi:hypothetical protein
MRMKIIVITIMGLRRLFVIKMLLSIEQIKRSIVDSVKREILLIVV